ncbi:MAG: hypothetical protein ACOZHQ_09105 [Thermodesulfobacteriota bacterium]
MSGQAMARRTWPARGGLAAVLAAMLAGMSLLAGCAAGYLDPGPNPAKVRVKLDLSADPDGIPPGAADVNRTVRWDWGLYLEGRDGQLLPLAPASGEGLKLIAAPRLTRETVFLAPAGRQKLRLIVEGYVSLRYGVSYSPYNLTYVQEDFSLDLQPGQEATISPKTPR